MSFLQRFAVSGYRSFAQRTEVCLRPLTILFGYNNAGKSALLRVLPLLADSVAPPRDLDRPALDLDSDVCRGASFRDLRTRLEPGFEVAFEMEWQDGCEVGFTVREEIEFPLQVTKLDVRCEGEAVRGRWMDGGFEMQSGEGAAEVHGLDFSGFLPVEDGPWGPLREARKRLWSFQSGLQWLGAMRRVPQRSFRLTARPPSRLGSDGEGFENVLFAAQERKNGLFEEVSSWFEEHLGLVLGTTRDADSSYASLTLAPVAAAGLAIRLADMGEGMSQVLPVLVALAQAEASAEPSSRILALEQPELHLHPEAEVALGRKLAETAAKEAAPTVFLETHSENLLLSVQLQVARNELDPKRVGLYWVERLENGRSWIQPMEMDEQGRIHDWPEDVFSEDMRLTRQLVSERMGSRA